MVLGLWRPVVAVPEGLVDRLSDQELDDVALHELAHVRRRDDWAKLAEALVAAVCFFHPAAWWLARRADADREVACDDWVVAATGKPGRYARSLLRLAGLGADRGAALAPGAFARKPMISERIELLMKTERNATPKVPRLILVSLCVLVLLATFASAGSGPAVGLSTMPLAELPPMPQPAARRDLADDTRGEDPVARAAALEALGDYAGTVVVMNPHDGRIYTIVNQEWAVRGGFAPASTAKLVTALAALDAGALDPSVRVMAQGKRVDLDEAVAYSNTEYFQRIGERAGAERYLATARTLGLGSPTGVNLPGEYAGRLPEGPVPAGLFGAGEGVEVTPMQLAVMVSALANGGTRVVPFVPRDGAAAMPGTPVAVRAEHLERLEPGMIGTVQFGTGGASALQGVTIAGKTGTALDPKGNLGLFISYAPVQSPQFVVVVVLRGHDVSGKTAAGVAGRLYNTLVEKFC
jgi:hypothetical protein